MKNCRVIATYFGPRRRSVNSSHTFSMMGQIIEDEKNISSGVKKDTIIVNHDTGNEEGRKFLDKINGKKTKDGKFIVLHRPFDQGIGGSFGSFNWAFEKFRKKYEYWIFNEDDYYIRPTNYFKRAISQLEADKKVAYICFYREKALSETRPLHCHGGCGATHIRFLEEAYKVDDRLPYSIMPMAEGQYTDILDGKSTSPGPEWYDKFEKEGEIAFTNIYDQLGYELEELKPELEGERFIFSVRHNTEI